MFTKFHLKNLKKNGERIAFKLLNNVAEFDNTEIYNRDMRDERRQEVRNNSTN